jgi:hypothetical protein
MREGAPGVSMYVIKDGLVEVRKKDPITGIDFLVAQLGPGNAVGEMSLLTGKPRSASVNTVEPTSVDTLTRTDFRNLLKLYPEISPGAGPDPRRKAGESQQAGRRRVCQPDEKHQLRSERRRARSPEHPCPGQGRPDRLR